MKRVKFNERLKIKDGVSIIYIFKKYINQITIILILAIIFILNTSNVVSNNFNNKSNELIAQIYNMMKLPINFVNSTIDGVQKYINLQKINDQLRTENFELKQQLEHLRVEISYNNSLRRLLNVVKEPHNEVITARMISKNFNNFEASFLINAGSNHGVAKNQMVMNDMGLIGKVVQVYPKSARIMAITDIKSRVPVLFKLSDEQAILAGSSKSTSQLDIKYIPQLNRIIDGEEVVASGVGGIFSLNTKIGRVKKFNDSNVIIIPYVNFNNIDYVIVIKD